MASLVSKKVIVLKPENEDSLRRAQRIRSWGARVIDLSKNFRITLSFLCFGEAAKPNSRLHTGGQAARCLYSFGGGAGFAASPGFGGAPPAVAGPPGRSSSGTASMSCSVNDSAWLASSFRSAAICSAVTGPALLPHSLRSYVRTSAIFWSVKVLSHGCITAVPNCWPLTLTGPCKPLRTIIAGRREPPVVNSEPASGGYCPGTPRPLA